MGRATVLVDPTSLAIRNTFTKHLKSYEDADSPLSGQSLILLGRWLECAPRYRLRSILKKLCEEQAIAAEVFHAMTARDDEIAERDLLESGECPDYNPRSLDLIRKQNTRDLIDNIFGKGVAGAETLNQKEIMEDGAQTGGIARKRKAKEHCSDEEASDNEEDESDQSCDAGHKRIKVDHGGIILKENESIKSVDTISKGHEKHQHCNVAKCKNCDEAYNLCLDDQVCQYHPRRLEIDHSYPGWDEYDIWNDEEWDQLDDEECHNEHPDGFSFPCCNGGPKAEGCKQGTHVPVKSRTVGGGGGGGGLSDKNA